RRRGAGFPPRRSNGQARPRRAAGAAAGRERRVENGSTAYATSQAERLVSECPAFSALVELQVLEALAPAGLAEPEIEFADIVVAAQRVGRALEDDPAVLHHVAVVGDAQGDLSVLLDQEERRPALDVDLADDVEDLAHEQGREPE